MIKYRKGDCLQDSEEPRILAHIVNNKGGFGKGFAFAVAKKYPIVKEKYKDWYATSLRNSHHFHLGNISAVRVNAHLTFINMLAQDGYKSILNPVPLDYKALELCLKNLNAYNKDRIPIWMPKIGAGLGGGNWERIETLINTCLSTQDVIIFEL